MDNSSVKTLGHDVSFVSSINLVGGSTLDPEVNRSIQETEATPKPDLAKPDTPMALIEEED